MPLDAITQLVMQYRYWILFPLAFMEGPILAFVLGSLSALGYFSILPSFVILLIGDLVPDTAYYLLGRYGERKTFISRYAKKIGIDAEHFEAVRRLWSKHPAKTTFLTKFAYGLSTPLLVSAGVIGMPLHRFLRYTVSISIIQYGVLLALGYNFGRSFALVSGTLEVVQLVAAGVAAVAVAYYFLMRYMRRKFMEEKAREEMLD